MRTLGRVNVPPIVQRHPALRWLAPLAVAGVVGVVATGVLQASATSSPEEMPDASAASLLAGVQRPALTGFSGTVVSRLSLGLPELPMVGGMGADSGSSLASLLTGSHTLKVWYGGPTKQRVALLGATEETDIFRSGRQLWQWSSSDRTAIHVKLPEHSADDASGAAGAAPSPERSLTPAGLADDLLGRLEPSTKVTVSPNHSVANRDAYELVLTPRTTATRIGSVRIAVDGDTKVPLGVQVFARGSRSAAIDVAFTAISFEQPADTVFSFNPPDDATVTEHKLRRPDSSRAGEKSSEVLPAAGSAAGGAARTPAGTVATSGTGWSTIVTLRGDSRVRKAVAGLQQSPLADASTRVSGTWGNGRLFSSDLVNVLVADDGRVFAGAVDPNALYAVAAK